MADDLTLPSRQRLINLINEDNADAGVGIGQVTFGAPVPNTTLDRNTRVTLTAIPGTGVTGSRTVFFDRLDLAVFFQDTDLVVRAQNPINTSDLITPFLEQHGVNFEDDDLIVDSMSYGQRIIRAKPGSYGWTGQVGATVKPPLIDLAVAVQVTAMDVFNTADITRFSRWQFIEAVNQANGLTLTNADIQLSAPVEIPPDEQDFEGRNTAITISALPDTDYTGSVTVTYKRVNVNAVYPAGFTVGGAWTDHNTTQQLLPTLLAQHAIKLRTDEIIDAPIADRDTQFYVQISDTSQVWEPGSAFLVDLADVPLDRVLTSLALGGFLVTGQSPSYAVADPYYDSLDQLQLLVNGQNEIALTSTDVTYSAPQAIAPDAFGRNTSVTISAGDPSEYVGSVTATYRRLDIAEFFPDGLTLTGSVAAVTTTHGALAMLNAQFNYALRANEFVDAPVALTDPYWSLTVTDNSEVWAPGTAVTVYFTAPATGGGSYFVFDDGTEMLLDSADSHLLDNGTGTAPPPGAGTPMAFDGGQEALLDNGNTFILDNP